MALLKLEAASFSGCEPNPLEAVADPVAGSDKIPRTVSAPFTSSVVAGVAVLIPTFAVAPDPD